MGRGYICVEKALRTFEEYGFYFDENANSFDEESGDICNFNVPLNDRLTCRFKLINNGAEEEDDELWGVSFLYQMDEGIALNKKYKKELKELLKNKSGIDILFDTFVSNEIYIAFPYFEAKGVEYTINRGIEIMLSEDVQKYFDEIPQHSHPKNNNQDAQ